jgi:hypothetical protein
VEPKKRSLAAGERDEFLRAAWRLTVAGETDAERLVFVDEMGANVSPLPDLRVVAQGRAGLRQRPAQLGQERHAALQHHRGGDRGPCLAVEGATTREVFEAYLERVLAPSLGPGQVVVMDNLSAHKGGRVREIVEGRGPSCCTCRPTRRT